MMLSRMTPSSYLLQFSTQSLKLLFIAMTVTNQRIRGKKHQILVDQNDHNISFFTYTMALNLCLVCPSWHSHTASPVVLCY